MATPRKVLHKVRCKVCSHPERHRIEMLRLAGSSSDALSARFGLKRDSIYRHMAAHVSANDKAALIADVPLRELADRAADEGLSLLSYFGIVRSTLIAQMLGAAGANDRNGTASLAGRAIDVLDKIGKLTGEMLNSASVVNIVNNNAVFLSPAFNRLERMLLEALTPYPDALQAVLRGLEALEASEEPQGRPMVTVEASDAA